MPEPVLELSQHELYFLPPGTPALAPATRVEVEVDGKVRAFLARLIWEDLNIEGRQCFSVNFREESDEIVWQETTYAFVNKDSISEEEIRNLICKNIGNSQSARLWHPSSMNWGVSWKVHGNAKVVKGHYLFDVTHFRWKEPSSTVDPLASSQQEFLDFCQQQLADENSSLNYALQWQDLEPEQKDELAFSCKNGDWATLHRLISLAQKVVTYSCGFFPVPRYNSSSWGFERAWSEKRRSNSGCIWSDRYRSAICNIVQPSFWLDEPLCHHYWRKNHHSSLRHLREVVCTMPTHHEVLEAQLELRDFLRPHLPESEIEALFCPT